MYLRLNAANWDDSEFGITHEQTDYDLLDKGDINVYIYGYPFDSSSDTWISSTDVYQAYLRDKLRFIADIEGIYTIIIFDKIIRERLDDINEMRRK